MEMVELMNGDIVAWVDGQAGKTALVYYPPEDEMKRLYNSP